MNQMFLCYYRLRSCLELNKSNKSVTMFMDCMFIDCKWPYGGIELAQLSTTLVVLDNEKKYCLESIIVE